MWLAVRGYFVIVATAAAAAAVAAAAAEARRVALVNTSYIT